MSLTQPTHDDELLQSFVAQSRGAYAKAKNDPWSIRGDEVIRRLQAQQKAALQDLRR